MADHLHDARYLIRRHQTPAFALGDDLIWHFVLLGFENCRLVKTDRGSVNTHVGENDIHIVQATRKSEMVR